MDNVLSLDIIELAAADVWLSKFLSAGSCDEKPRLDLSTHEAQRALTAAVLKAKYNIIVSLDSRRLCPAIPNRLAYVRYIYDLVLSTHGEEPGERMCGVDIGTGHVAIYPLLACSEYADINFVGTDIDLDSLNHASQIILDNGFGNRIQLLSSPDAETIFFNSMFPDGSTYFTMCNPPFYSSRQEILEKRSSKKTAASASETMALDSELIADGGEVGFVSRMIEQSFIFRDKVVWFSSLLGKMESVGAVVDILRRMTISNYAIHELVPSAHQASTRRWVACWSFKSIRPPNELCLAKSHKLKTFNPSHTQFFFDAKITDISLILHLVKKLDQCVVEEDLRCLHLVFPGDIWSRSYRRKAKKDVVTFAEDDRCTIIIRLCDGTVEVYWRSGIHYNIFESFCGWIKRSVGELQ
ncbi:unnamed protein product [Kuraishia capsulata CBS 1993]|uniref:U6 small nuclear RNA (adenine-(43)-N(6))-methyltransferase n=1 Tax=Kuraishia capsulata CBS 1993 TaxID=1382522 RepID=W6MXG4_9ASCO|nr:uncharacterized protein KUCA_T00004830001 [Kuraishia capsulata CBS 1993]CDK28845.1 unnamed protein product [Kuraishia capsulata CBS 1993]